jgi:hypothetical protein
MREPWIGSFARRIVAPICGEFACGAFTGHSSLTLRRSDKEMRVRKMRLERYGLGILPAAGAQIDSEHPH